jgi:hypothetical protein
MDQADLADDLTIQQVDERLHREHPGVFESQERLRQSAATRLVRSVLACD